MLQKLEDSVKQTTKAATTAAEGIFFREMLFIGSKGYGEKRDGKRLEVLSYRIT